MMAVSTEPSTAQPWYGVAVHSPFGVNSGWFRPVVSFENPYTPPQRLIPRSGAGLEYPVEESDFWARLTRADLESRAPGTVIVPPPSTRRFAAKFDDADPQTRALLTSSIKRVASILHAIVASKAARASLPIQEAYFQVDHDDEEGSRQLVAIVRVKANAAQALAFWDSLDYEIDRWMADLTPEDQTIVTNQVGLRFVWNGAGEG